MIDPSDGLGIRKLYDDSASQWVSLADYSPNFTQYPGVTYSTEKRSNAEASETILRFPAPAYRINSDGLVLMRGLMRKNTGANIAAGDVVLSRIPAHLKPKNPQELRFWGETCVLIYEQATQQLKVNDVYYNGIYINLGGIMYYVD